MAKKLAISRLRKAVREVAAPFWEQVASAEIDRFFLDRLLRGLLRRFREDRFARVKQGGLHGDARAELARVFIDLDATPESHWPPEGDIESERIVASWMAGPRVGVARDGRRARRGSRRAEGGHARTSVPVEVVLGGPGQGKSTVGRFLVLIHASILLLTSPIAGMVTAADAAHIEAFLGSLSGEDIPFPKTVRLPLWVELRELVAGLFEDAESKTQPLAALLRWIAVNDLRESGDAAPLETSLESLPWVMVLDGLDEVPPQDGRALVRACVESLRARFPSGAGWIIGSSRPQSYEAEVFGEALFERILGPLSKARAEVYATRFAECLHGEEEAQREDLLRGMRSALANPSTAALMTNPLLVTIMAAIVLHHGEPSDKRWTLFEEYYRTLYARETERRTFASPTLRRHSAVIDAIHMHVGMALQARSESDEGVSALMSQQELREIIRQHLIESYSEGEAEKLADEILRAAEQRLVLLVESRTGMYGFDLRSFQEFMAAWQIVSLKEVETTELLKKIAPLRAWQNVVLFAIGQQYAKGSKLAWERSVGLCAELDCRIEDGYRCALPGARLALTILGEAPYGKASRPRRELMSRAMELLRLPPGSPHLQILHGCWELDRDLVLDAVAGSLNEASRREAAWAMLMSLPEDPRADALAVELWPTAREERKAILGWCVQMSLYRARTDPGRRLASRVLGDLSIVEPSQIWGLLPEGHVSDLLRHLESAVAHLTLGRGQGSIAWVFGRLPNPGASFQEEEFPFGNSAPWTVLRALHRFRADGTHVGLASMLEALATEWPDRDRWEWSARAPWPLVACVVSAASADDLEAIARRLREGELGDRQTWTQAEERWLAGAVGLADLESLAAHEDPLRAILVEGCAPPYAPHLGSYIQGADGENSDTRELRDLHAACRGSTAPWVRRMIAEILYALMDSEMIPSRSALSPEWPSPDDFIHVVDTAQVPLDVSLMLTLFPTLDVGGFVRIARGTKQPIVPGFHEVEGPSARGLVQSLCDALPSLPDSDRIQEALVDALTIDPAGELQPALSVKPRGDSLSAWLLRFVSGSASPADVPGLARSLLTVNNEWDLRRWLALLDTYAPSRPLVVPLIEALLSSPDAPLGLRAVAIDYLAGRIARASAGLTSPEQWAAFGLPAPPPMTNPPERPEKAGAQIATIEIANLRAFPQRFTVDAPTPSDSGQWMVFLGENATGKTTLLRAIAMALASSSDAAAVPSNLDGPLRRDASGDGSVRIQTSDGRDLLTTVTGPPGDERVVAAENPLRPWVVGYGCRRGSATSGTDIDNAFAPFRDLDNLFDRPRGVLRASGWLKELQRLAKNNGKRSKDIFEAAREALRGALLGAEAIVVENEVSVLFEGNRKVPLSLLSDGYLTTAGWIVDLMARWLKRNEHRKNIDDKFCAAMEGVVLLDEIDLHLHPRWQERIIEDVRTLFPRMTFIATTHHPLTLRGARKGEVFILGDHDGSGFISAIQRDIPPGTRVDELITGEWFNRPSAIIDEETRQLLARHQRLVQDRVKAVDPERRALESKLRERLGRFADTSLERLAATIAARHLATSMPEPSAKERERVKSEVLAILERREKKKRS